MKNTIWNDVDIDFTFDDASKVIQRHQTYQYECFNLIYKTNFFKKRNLIASKDHMIKISIDNIKNSDIKNEIKYYCSKGQIPKKENIHCDVLGYLPKDDKQLLYRYLNGEVTKDVFENIEILSTNHIECYIIKFKSGLYKEVFVKREPIDLDTQQINETEFWIPFVGIFYLYDKYGKLDFKYFKLCKIEDVGKLDCFCVSTNTGQYKACGLIHHNSVLTQNIIFHCIEHRDKIALALIDIKQTEYTFFKGMNGIVGVANTVEEAVELLRIARAVMYKRNKELAKHNVKKISEYTPTQKTGKVFITGRDYDEHDIINIKENDQERQLSASELVNYLILENETQGELVEIDVCLNGTDWITVNSNCVDFIYADEFQTLVIICDELAELTLKGGLKSAEGKLEDQMKDEISSILSSIAQLGRSSGIHVQIATQKPKAEIINTTLRSNLGWRAFAGKATETGSSLVALDNTLATTIDNTYPGAGIVQSAGVPAFLRYYFSKFEDLNEYYSKRGLDNLGYSESAIQNTDDFEELGGEEIINTDQDNKEFEFEEEKASISQQQDQDWENI